MIWFVHDFFCFCFLYTEEFVLVSSFWCVQAKIVDIWEKPRVKRSLRDGYHHGKYLFSCVCEVLYCERSLSWMDSCTMLSQNCYLLSYNRIEWLWCNTRHTKSTTITHFPHSKTLSPSLHCDVWRYRWSLHYSARVVVGLADLIRKRHKIDVRSPSRRAHPASFVLLLFLLFFFLFSWPDFNELDVAHLFSEHGGQNDRVNPIADHHDLVSIQFCGYHTCQRRNPSLRILTTDEVSKKMVGRRWWWRRRRWRRHLSWV